VARKIIARSSLDGKVPKPRHLQLIDFAPANRTYFGWKQGKASGPGS